MIATTFPQTASMQLDRGGYFAADEAPYEASVSSFQVLRLSTQPPHGLRTLDGMLWYPTDDRETAPDEALGAVRDAPLASGAADLPMLIHSHGLCLGTADSSFLTSALARAGYLVLELSHTGGTSSDPDCSSFAAQIGSFLERPGDVRAGLDALEQRIEDPGSWLFSAGDLQRVGLTGHSFGGQTAVRVAAEDLRVRAVLAMAPSYAVVAGVILPLLPLDVPTMVQAGRLDSQTPFESNAVALYDGLAASRYLVAIDDTGHFAFTGSCPTSFLGADVPECGPGTLEPSVAHEHVVRYALAFLGAHVAGDRRWGALLTPLPGVTVEREDDL